MEAKEIFEAFGMTQGVNLIESNKEKKGPKYGKAIDISQLSQSSLS